MDQRLVDVSHEALIRGWPRLQQWIREDRDGQRLLRRITFDATEWEKSKDKGLLYNGARLLQAREWRLKNKDGLNELERRFLDASEAAGRRARRLREIISGVFVLLVAGASWEWWLAWEQAKIALSHQLSVQASEAAKTNSSLGLLLAVAAQQKAATAEANAVLQSALLDQSKLVRHLWYHHARNQAATRVVFSPDGRFFASGDPFRNVILWTADGDVLFEREVRGGVNALTFSPDSRLLAAGSSDKSVVLWDTSSGERRAILDEHRAQVNALAFNFDGTKLFSGGADRRILVWDTRDGHVAERLGHSASVTALALSPNGNTLASADADGTIILWDPANVINTGSFHTKERGQIRSAAFTPDGSLLATSSIGGDIVFWDLKTHLAAKRLASKEQQSISSMAFSPSGDLLALGDLAGVATLWDWKSGLRIAQLRGHEKAIASVAFSPKGDILASASEDRTVRLWSVHAGAPVVVLSDYRGVAFSADGALVASATADGKVVVSKAATGEPSYESKDAGTNVSQLYWGGAGKLFALRNDEDGLFVWDVAAGHRLFGGDDERSTSVAFDKAGGVVALGNADGSIVLRAASNGQILKELKDSPNRITSVAFGSDARIASGDRAGRIVIWDTDSGKQAMTLDGHSREAIASIAFSAQGDLLASGGYDGGLVLWRAVDGKQVFKRGGSADKPVYAVGFTSDGRILASGGEGGTVKLWSVPTGALIRQLKGLDGKIVSLAFSPDGRRLGTSISGQGVLIWDLKFEDWVKYACDKANRNLSCTEWGAFMGPESKYQRVCDGLPMPVDWDAQKNSCRKPNI